MSEKNKCIKKKEEDPWSQVDDLAEELEDLRKQIEKGTTAAHDSNTNQITEEVGILSLIYMHIYAYIYHIHIHIYLARHYWHLPPILEISVVSERLVIS